MLATTSAYDAPARTLRLTDADTAPVGVVVARRVVQVVGPGRYVVAGQPSLTATATVRVGHDGAYQYALQRVNAATGVVLAESAPVLHIEQGSQRAALSSSCLRHAFHPERRGPDAQMRLDWLNLYATRASLEEQNVPAVRAKLAADPAGSPTSPAAPFPALVGEPYLGLAGIPLPAAGIEWRELGGNFVQVTLALAYGSTFTATVTFEGAGLSDPEPVAVQKVTLGGQLAFQLLAKQDGLYQFTLLLGKLALLRFYVPVQRTGFRRLREQVRALGLLLGQRRGPVAAQARTVAQLARLVAVEAAARTNQVGLALRLAVSATTLPGAASPTALYPAPRA